MSEREPVRPAVRPNRERYPLPPVPDGWYGMGPADALAPGEVRALRRLDRELVAFRDEAGTVRLFDAHCPHLGAHLGVGGRVAGDGIRCPFHGWRFDGEGRCVEVPRLDRDPPDARLVRHPVREIDGHLFAWHHARGEPPSWEPPVLREGDPARWTPWIRERHEVRTHVQDMAENILDRAHFVHVHDMEEAAAPRFEIRFDGPAMTVEQNLKMTHAAGREVASRTTNHGPGLSLTRVDVGQVHSVTFIAHTPIDADRVAFELAFSMHRLADPEATAAIERINRELVNAQALQDMPIWEHKIYRAKPILTALDGPVHAFRRWYRQFHSTLPGAEGEGA
ncbi:MAG: Rieske 2Fe-2S domain-containing protein [Myxococcales bacterium]|nr:Rieske 2Fe-2S domain-containing protein [Myxococcales bacterium]